MNIDITNEQLIEFFKELKEDKHFDKCEACEHYNYLIVHHWYDIYDNKHELKTTYPRPWAKPEFFNGENTLYYHERKICYRCNQRLTKDNIRRTKGGGTSHYKVTDNEHLMPPWNIQKEFSMKCYSKNNIVDNVLDKLYLNIENRV